jgi:hypothetical protein
MIIEKQFPVSSFRFPVGSQRQATSSKRQATEIEGDHYDASSQFSVARLEVSGLLLVACCLLLLST